MKEGKEAKDIKGRLQRFFSSKQCSIGMEIIIGVLAFAIPFLMLVIAFVSKGFSPFDSNGPTSMMLDQRDQYISYLRYYQSVLKGEGSLIYTMGKAFGGDFMSIFTYYLASPFNLLIVLINEADLPSFFTFSAIAKLSFASLNFYLLARFAFKKRSLIYLPFAIGFALMSYNLVYMSNFMYLDVIMILPLCVLGLLLLEEGKGRLLYMLSLCYALATSWYLGAMVCIFLVLLFLSRLVVSENKLVFVYRFVAFSLGGGLLAGAFWITAFLHFNGTKASSSMPRDSTFFPLSVFFSGWLENGYTGTNDISRNTGYMTMFVGSVAVVFGLLYPFNKGYSKKERISESVLFLVICLSSLSNILSALWHGGKDPSWFPTRFSFLMGFLMCYLGTKEAIKLKETWKIGLIFPLIVASICLPVALLTDNKLSKNDEALFYSLSYVSLALFIVTYVAVVTYVLSPSFKNKYLKFAKEGALIGGMIAIGIASSYRGVSNILDANLANSAYASSSLYKEDCELEEAFSYIKSLEESQIYRMEATFNRPSGTNVINNNPLFYGYKGLNHYSSSEKKEVSDFMKKLGFHINPFYETYDGGSTSAINSYLGVKYLIDDDNAANKGPIFQRNEEGVFQRIHLGQYKYYRNEYVLPLGFVSHKQSGEHVSQGETREGKESVYWYDDFEYQNCIFRTICGDVEDENGAKPIFNALPYTTSLSEGITYEEDEHGVRKYTGSKGSLITLSFQIPEDYYGQNLYFGVKDTPDSFSFYLDGSSYRVNDYFYSGIKGFEDKPSHTHTLRIFFKEDVSNARIRPELYAEDSKVLKEYLTALRKGGLVNAIEKKGMFSYAIEGDFSYQGGDDEFLFTIPYEKEISIRIDGQKRQVLRRNDIFSAISLEGIDAGNHHIEIAYVDTSFVAGFAVSMVSLGGVVPALIFSPRLENKINRRKEEATTPLRK